jgi:hypothetical protein
VDLVKLRRTRITSGLVVLALVVSVPLATTALAQPAVVGTITGDPVAPGEEATLSLMIQPTEGTVDSFTLTPPTNWQLVTGSPSPGGPTYTIVGNKLIGTGVNATTSESASVDFRVKTGCQQGDWDWTLDARDSENNQFGIDETSELVTAVNGDCSLAITTQPKDAAKNSLITGTAFDSSSNFVTVELKNGLTQTVAYFPVDVTFDLATGTGLVSTGLSAGTKTTVNGVATFSGSAATLSISNANEPFVTDYKLKPKTVGTYAGLTGGNSGPFDIWDAGCKGNGCNVSLSPQTSSDLYATSENVGMGASLLGVGGAGSTNIFCPTQQLIFSSNVFFHATTNNGPTPAPVFLVSHISAADRKAAANNGNKVMGWCVGLKGPGPWNFQRQDTNGNGTIGTGDLYVGMAPKCPSKNASSKAPCIVSQTGDGVGGTFIRGWLPGGDPPRRT